MGDGATWEFPSEEHRMCQWISENSNNGLIRIIHMYEPVNVGTVYTVLCIVLYTILYIRSIHSTYSRTFMLCSVVYNSIYSVYSTYVFLLYILYHDKIVINEGVSEPLLIKHGHTNTQSRTYPCPLY